MTMVMHGGRQSKRKQLIAEYVTEVTQLTERAKVATTTAEAMSIACRVVEMAIIMSGKMKELKMSKDGFSATRQTAGGKGDQAIGTTPQENYDRVFGIKDVDGLSEKDNNTIEEMIETIKKESPNYDTDK